MIFGPTGPIRQPDHRGDRMPRRQSPGEMARSITGRDYLSYSQISTYQACPAKWFFRYDRQYPPERISAALPMGSGIHAAIQSQVQALMEKDIPPTIDEMMATYHRTWAECSADIPIQFGRGQNADSLAATAEAMLRAVLETPYAWPHGAIIGIEEARRVPMGPMLPDLLAKLDLIEYRDGQLILTDYKTARSIWSPAMAEANANQMLLYAHAAREIARDLYTEIELRFVIITKTKEPKVDHIDIPLDRDRLMSALATVRQVFRAMHHRIFYPNPSVMNCSTCPYAQRCKRWFEIKR